MIETVQRTSTDHPALPLIQTHIPLKDKSWFRTGGPAEYFAQPSTEPAFQEVLQFAQEYSLPITLIGHGANCLISDEGIRGLVIRPALQQLSIEEIPNSSTVLVHAQAGASMDALIEFCLEHQISGLEEFSGIPGTVGGSIFINLHYFQFLLGSFLDSAHVIEKKTGTITRVTPDWFLFGYNQSKLQEQTHFLTSATFKLKKVSEIETAYACGRRVEIIRHRTSRYPSKNTCGSFFRNFHEHEVTEVSNNKKMIFVAYYLDKLGVKGTLRVGDAIVSYQHANMLVNQGNATSTDIITLARTMQQMVYDRYNIIPQPECRLLGFSEYPLL